MGAATRPSLAASRSQNVHSLPRACSTTFEILQQSPWSCCLALQQCMLQRYSIDRHHGSVYAFRWDSREFYGSRAACSSAALLRLCHNQGQHRSSLGWCHQRCGSLDHRLYTFMHRWQQMCDQHCPDTWMSQEGDDSSCRRQRGSSNSALSIADDFGRVYYALYNGIGMLHYWGLQLSRSQWLILP